MSLLIPLGSIDPNPWQPRTRFNDDALIELACDIERNGLLQPSLGRLVEPSGGAGGWKLHGEARPGLAVNADFVSRLLASGARVQLAAGERRFRAYKILQAKGTESGAYVADLFARPVGFDALPLQLAPFDDVRMATLAWSENESRQDTTPVERARFLERLTRPVEAGGFGWTHERAAAEVGMERSAVSNLIRLLRLPAAALDALDSGTISQAQARAIVTADAEISADDWTVLSESSYLPGGLPQSIDDLIAAAAGGVPADALRDKVARTVTYAKERQERKLATAEEDAKKAERTRKDLDKRGLTEVAVEDVPTSNTLGGYGKYETLRDVPKGCTKDCACRGIMREYSGAVVSICTSPKRYKSLQNQKAKEERVPAKEAIVDYLARFQTELVDGAGGIVWTSGVTLLLAERLKYSTSVKETRAVAAAMLEDGTVTAEQAEVLGNFAGGTWENREGSDVLLVSLPASVVLRFFVESLVRKNLAHLVESRRTSHKLIDALFAPDVCAADVSVDTQAAPAAPREEGDWERATRLDLQEGVDPAVNLADVEARFQETRAHYRALREADAPEEFATARARLADLGRALVLSRAAMPPAPEVSADTSGLASEAVADGDLVRADQTVHGLAGLDKHPADLDSSPERDAAVDIPARPRPDLEDPAELHVRLEHEARHDQAVDDVGGEPQPVEIPVADAEVLGRRADGDDGGRGAAVQGDIDPEAERGSPVDVEPSRGEVPGGRDVPGLGLSGHGEGSEDDSEGEQAHGGSGGDGPNVGPESAANKSVETPPALTPEARIEALASGDVSVLAGMSDGTLQLAAGRAFSDDWPAHIDEAIQQEQRRRADEFDAPVAEAGRRVILVGCGKQKATHAAPAKDLYTGPLFKKHRRNAEQLVALGEADYWFILSAEHGLIEPDIEIAPYDRSMEDLDGPAESAEWAQGIRDAYDALDYLSNAELPEGMSFDSSRDSFVVYAGASYATPLRAVFDRVEEPYAGLGIGERLARLDVDWNARKQHAGDGSTAAAEIAPEVAGADA